MIRQRKPIARKTPLKRTQLVRHHQAVPKRRKGPPRRGSVEDPARLDWAATQPCCVTGIWPATTHHYREYGSPKRDDRIMRLVDWLHMKTNKRHGIPCVEDGKRVFERFHGVVLRDEVAKLAAQYEAYTQAHK